jgi:Ni/Co efflux regulator RcnB
MKRLLIIITFFVLGVSYATAQRKASKEERARLTPEQRMALDHDKGKGKRRSVDVSKKVSRAKKQDHKARKLGVLVLLLLKLFYYISTTIVGICNLEPEMLGI